MIDSDALEELRARLLALRDELDSLVRATEAGARPVDLGEAIGRVSRVDAMQQQAMVAENRRAAQARRQQVEAALNRIDDGEYGECRACGDEIDAGRLRARPEAAFCLECQGRREQGDGR